MKTFVIFVKQNEDKYAKNKKCSKFRGHYHFTGEYRGAEHCILNYRTVHIKKLLQFFTKDLIMIIVLS